MHVRLEAANSGRADHPVRLGERRQAGRLLAGLAVEVRERVRRRQVEPAAGRPIGGEPALQLGDAGLETPRLGARPAMEDLAERLPERQAVLGREGDQELALLAHRQRIAIELVEQAVVVHGVGERDRMRQLARPGQRLPGVPRPCSG